MLNRAFKLSSNWQFFHQEFERLKGIFARLHYPETLVENTVRHFIETKVTENACPKQRVSNERDAPVRIVLPHGQKSRTFEPAQRHAAYARKTEKPIRRPKSVQFPWWIINS